MELMLLRVFQRQVLLQCEFMLMAAREVDAAMSGPPDQDPEVLLRRTFYAIQNFLNAAANVSKTLWAQSGRFAQERKPLRDSIGVLDSSPLRQVTMRNNFEHLDERIDHWWAASTNHNHIDLNIGPANFISGASDIDKFRQYDPTTRSVIFWGQAFNLKALVDEAHRILPVLRHEANKPHWEP